MEETSIAEAVPLIQRSKKYHFSFISPGKGTVTQVSILSDTGFNDHTHFQSFSTIGEAILNCFFHVACFFFFLRQGCLPACLPACVATVWALNQCKSPAGSLWLYAVQASAHVWDVVLFFWIAFITQQIKADASARGNVLSVWTPPPSWHDAWAERLRAVN